MIKVQRLILTIFLSTLSFQGFGQEIVIINDKDGYVNVRENADIKSKIIGKQYEDDIFYSVKSKDNDWYEVYLENGATGYVHGSRIIPLSNLQKLNTKAVHWKDEVLTFQNDTLFFQIQVAKFEPSKHQIKNNNGYPERIDNHEMHGTFGNLPKIEFGSIKLVVRSKDIVLPKEQFNDCYEIDLSRMWLYSDKKGRLFISSTNSDGAGGYEAIWVIKNNKYLKREILVP